MLARASSTVSDQHDNADLVHNEMTYCFLNFGNVRRVAGIRVEWVEWNQVSKLNSSFE